MTRNTHDRRSTRYDSCFVKRKYIKELFIYLIKVPFKCEYYILNANLNVAISVHIQIKTFKVVERQTNAFNILA